MNDEERKERAALELLVSDGKTGSLSEFKPNLKDKRFEAFNENKEFALDPTNKEFKRVA